VTVAIGPEGGWTSDEADRLLAAGYQPVALAAHILRFETAAVAAATLIGVARLRGARD
jgi:16S rRNA (uracil1498-N3)-methyltransferase